MALTRDFRETVRARIQSDSAFRAALLSEAVELLLTGDVSTGKSILRDYVNATIGFDALSTETGLPAKSLMRMLSKSGNPRADNLFNVIAALQKNQGIQLSVSTAA